MLKQDIVPLVSVITIVYNDKEGIIRTIKSVLEQDFKNFEFIIIDGGSNDGTKEIIEKYKDKITYYISEKDKGIYDAMNKGILAARGKWVNFMNAGDIFYSSKVLSNVFNKNKYNNKALIYGYKYQDNKKVLPLPLKDLESGIMMANHQSMFFNRIRLGKELIYSLEYPIYGDYELVNRIYSLFGEKSFVYLKIPIAIYAGGGISSTVSTQKRLDKFKIIYHSYGLIGVLRAILYSKMGINIKK